jgi:hypothetical protein
MFSFSSCARVLTQGRAGMAERDMGSKILAPTLVPQERRQVYRRFVMLHQLAI